MNRKRLIPLFMLCLSLPSELSINLGSIKLPTYRLICLVLLVSAISQMARVQTRKTKAIDNFMILYTVWCVISLLVNHGIGVWQFAGMTAIETLGPYCLARALIQNSDDFRHWVRCYLKVIIFIFPFALYETLFGEHLLRDLARAVTGYGPLAGRPERLGLTRAFGPFEHPIHYGVFCAVMLGLVSALGAKSLKRVCFLVAAVGCSLSSGPLLAASVQIGLKLWDRMTKTVTRRWRLLGILSLATYIAIDILSNRTPFHVIVTYMTFRLASSYNRILIWEWGTRSVENNPIFGIGQGEWERLPFMSSSMDNFWLLTAVRYGLPALGFLVAALGLLLWRLSKLTLFGEIQEIRKGWAITFAGIVMVGATVHFWGGLYCLIIFVFGSIAWILDREVRATVSSPNSHTCVK